MEFDEKRQHRVCFTGHRPETMIGIERIKVKSLLKAEIKKAIQDGYVTFISGMARGIDMWAAEIVLAEKKKNPDIHLICASPHEGFEKRWDETEKQRYRDILSQADIVKYICEHASRSCYQIRNEWMVDRSARVIAAFNGEKGGTQNTILYAQRKGVEVINILKVSDTNV